MSTEYTIKNVYYEYITHIIRSSSIATVLYFILYPYYNMYYQYMFEMFGNERYVFTFTMSMTHILCYWIINGFFMYCDYTGMYSEYKIERLRGQIPSKQLVIKTLKAAILGQILIEPVGIMLILYPLMKSMNTSFIFTDELHEMNLNPLKHPNIVRNVLFKFIFCDIFNSWMFYFAHRLLHHPKLYGPIHKQHHEYKGTISIAAECMRFYITQKHNIYRFQIYKI